MLPALLAAGCGSGPAASGTDHLQAVSLTVIPWPASAQIYVAVEKGFFREEGLDVALETTETGRQGLEKVLSGEADFCTVGETPLAAAALEGERPQILATLCKIDRSIRLVARRDRGISSPEDLRGKSIGVVKGTTCQFFAYILLVTSHVDPEKVHFVYLEPDALVGALADSRVDAAALWMPYTVEARKRLGDKAVVLDEPGLYTMTWNLVTNPGQVDSDPDGILRLLRALKKANRFVILNPAEARRIVALRTGLEPSVIEKDWDDYVQTLDLDQSLILHLEDQARWMMGEESPGKEMPDFASLIYTEALRTVLPESVAIAAPRGRD